MKKTTVFLVDDHEIFRNGLKQLIDGEPDLKVVGEATNGEESLQLLAAAQPDVVIMDIRMPGLNGIEAGRFLMNSKKKSRLLFFSLYDNPDYVQAALEMGAKGYILKDTSNKIFLHAIRVVSRDQYYFTGDITDVLVRRYHAVSQGSPEAASASHPPIALSRREVQIMGMISQGLTNRDIADEFGISIRTIEAHRQNILRKFGVNNIEEAVEHAKAANVL